MDTIEHMELGDALTFDDVDNPYLKRDADGRYFLNLQTLSNDQLPHPLPDLWLSPGQIICAAGDYFTDKNWDMKLNLPSCQSFESIDALGKYLISKPVVAKEQQALLNSYLTLAAEDVSPSDIERIISISSARYIPFSTTLNGYAQLLMLTLRVKNYGEMLNRNQTHFTPWAVRVYVLGHHMALQYARCAWYLNQCAEHGHFDPPDALCEELIASLMRADFQFSQDHLRDQAHRFHALSLGLELFTFHYYSDHFAAGHLSQVGDLRKELPRRFGTLGSILVNNIHNELNEMGALTYKPYDPTPNPEATPLPATGDGLFDAQQNACNKKACQRGMQVSLGDIARTLHTGAIPDPTQFSGLEQLPDVHYHYRQCQPLLLMHNGAIYQRRNTEKIHIMSPSGYQAMLNDPLRHGYTELTSAWQAFALVVKLRLLPFIFKGNIQPVPDEYEEQILQEEPARNPEFPPITNPPYSTAKSKSIVPEWSLSREPRQTAVSQRGLFAKTSGKNVSSSSETLMNAINSQPMKEFDRINAINY